LYAPAHDECDAGVNLIDGERGTNIKKLQMSSPVWKAGMTNCTSFIGSTTNFRGMENRVG
jgi:hypothetical protein